MNVLKEAAKNKFVSFLTLFGISLLLFSLLSDLVGGKSGIGSAQLLVAILGAALALTGIGLFLARREADQAAEQSSWLEGLLNFPNILWVVIGFAVAYVFFMVLPMFFDPVHRIIYFYRYLPDRYPIGVDLLATLDSVRSWFAEGVAKVYYPPLLTVLFAPFLLISYPLNYYIITFVTLLSYFILAFLLPFLIVGKGSRSIVMFLFGVSVFSYGLQFELERGQFHTLAMLLCILAVYIFHRHPRYRFFAYVLFCISVQFKIYPALFAVMLVDDWRDWKTNIKRFGALGVANFMLLFILGYSYFSNFISHITASSGSYETWRGNHSIGSFFKRLATDDKLLVENARAWVQSNLNLLTNLFLVVFVVCFLLVWLNAYRRNTPGIDSLLMMACVLGGLLIPSVNNDYTLPLLTAPFALVMSERFTRSGRGRVIVILLMIISSFAYASTLAPFKYRPLYLQNSFPLLIILLATTTWLSFLRNKEETAPAIVTQSE